MRLLRTFAAVLLGLPMATPISVAAEDAPFAPEVQRRVVVVVLARRIRGYAAMAKASSNCQVEKGRLPRSQASQTLAISLEELGISRRVLTNPLVVAVSPRLQRLLDDRCALAPVKEAEALRLAENELRTFSRAGSQNGTGRALAFIS
ncbi:hypothetical protein Syncc8109_2112 [Synechococcus sp. WH 8109]|uniref:hypothetical protein n=1 Tax=Synechococcus sp. WH 8109 TaxID=166314 RepID=UPI0001B8DFB9|nr:hypothetical protein [Synechococcus sp. WH 8109]AHF64450.1 hypothetical protein Syncc8109_2112 [Synechococcus sp. WH 8109]